MPASRRLRLVILLHMPLGHRADGDGSRERECAVLSAAAAVVTTSEWCREWVLEAYAARPDAGVGSRARGRRRRARDRQ